MEAILISVGIAVFTELLKLISKKFKGTYIEWWMPHIIVFVLSLVAVVVLRVTPQEFVEEAVKIFGQAIAFYEIFWKRVVQPAIDKGSSNY